MFNARFEARAPLNGEGFAERLRICRAVLVIQGFAPMEDFEPGFRVVHPPIGVLAVGSIALAQEIQVVAEAGEVVVKADCSAHQKRYFLSAVLATAISVVGLFCFSVAIGDFGPFLSPLVGLGPVLGLVLLFALNQQLGLAEMQCNTIAKELAG